jgi:8-amino-7-oxononanoate synthase
MDRLPKSMALKLEERKDQNAFRQLPSENALVDFSSNDYLGFAASKSIFDGTHQLLADKDINRNGATGSRLISGNYALYAEAEKQIAVFHQSESALLFNSGYDANVGFFSCVPQRNDVILYDELCHASIRDGIRLSNAKSYKFHHNDPEHLEILIQKHQNDDGEIYIATESVFSMDGDSPNLEELVSLTEKYSCHLIVDEAHALGVFGTRGEGLVQDLGLHDRIFARIMTFGKGLGCHGAAILGPVLLEEYLVNFSRSFIYTTGLPPHSVATILTAYQHLQYDYIPIEKLRDNILMFSREKNRLGLKPIFVHGKSAIQSAIIPGNEKVKSIAVELQQRGFDVRAILSPTVPEGQERLRICLHSGNSENEISSLLSALAGLLF